MISVIVPIYNAEAKLKRCIDSVLNQTHRDFELILINDGSTDGSLEICENAALLDERVKVISIENSGVSNARNLGLEKAKGDYISFVDSDDYVTPDYLYYLYETLISTSSDIAIGGTIDVKDGVERKTSEDNGEVFVIKARDFKWIGPLAHTVVWGALYRRKVIEELKFDSSLFVGEDTYFFAKALKNASTVSYVKRCMYYYVIYSESESHGSFTEKKITLLSSWQKIVDLFEHELSCDAAYSMTCMDFLSDYRKNKVFREKYYKYVLREFRKYFKSLLTFCKQERDYITLIRSCYLYLVFTLHL